MTQNILNREDRFTKFEELIYKEFLSSVGRNPFANIGIRTVQNFGMIKRHQIHTFYIERHVVPVRHVDRVLEQ